MQIYNMNSICWFRQDLRLEDNPAFFHAFGKVLPIYILDDKNAGAHKMGAASRVWLHHSLLALDRSLREKNGKLHLFSGDAIEVFEKLVKMYQVGAVFWNRCYEPWRIERDKKIEEYLKKNGARVFTYNSSLLWEPHDVLKDDGTPYKIFTPFYKRALANESLIQKPIPHPENVEFANIESVSSLNLMPKLPWGENIIKDWNVGEAAADKRLQNFLKNGIKDYKEGRNFPAKDNISRLSPHLHFGEISPRKIWHCVRELEQDSNTDVFLSELGWREFSYNLLYHFPELPYKNLREKFDSFPWKEDESNLKLWQTGMTGYPIVDAGMRELWQTGYMHNRVRMIVGSFLVKNLLLHWRHGEKWFWDCLFDADLASNSASWQWVAGCGTDANPYFRVFNPLMQGHKFDPDGTYTRFYVPELEKIPNEYLFSPWSAPSDVLRKARITQNYPKPIVNLESSRDRAIDSYKSLSR